MRLCLFLTAVLLTLTSAAQTQPNSDVKFVADTLIVQADGSYETDPDLATLTFESRARRSSLKMPTAKPRSR
jgi:uncharacterized protein YggE